MAESKAKQKVVVILMGESVVGNKADIESIETCGVQTCYVAVVNDRNSGMCGMAHFDGPEAVKDGMDHIVNNFLENGSKIENIKVSLYGGDPTESTIIQDNIVKYCKELGISCKESASLVVKKEEFLNLVFFPNKNQISREIDQGEKAIEILLLFERNNPYRFKIYKDRFLRNPRYIKDMTNLVVNEDGVFIAEKEELKAQKSEEEIKGLGCCKRRQHENSSCTLV